MYICKDPVCDPCCDFCWYCKQSEFGEPLKCTKGHDKDFWDGVGYCDDFRCRLHECDPRIEVEI